MYKLFIPDPIPGKRLVPLIADEVPQSGKRLFQDLPAGSFDGVFERVSELTHCDLVLLPHEFNVLAAAPDYLERELARAAHGRKVTLISAYQDSPEPIIFPNTLILRPSLYKSEQRSNEIVMPAYVEDIGAEHGAESLPKPARPSVGFVGKAGFASLRERGAYLVRNYLLRRGARRQGLYFRRRALAALAHDSAIALSTTVRRSYSGHRLSIELTPEQARSEYIESLRENLFTLAPRGDGNYSLRFYETLAAGRIPILIDTDMALPLEDRIDYDEFILRVPWQHANRTNAYVKDFFASHTEAELEAMQRKARDTFEKYLYMPAFLRQVLTREHLAMVN